MENKEIIYPGKYKPGEYFSPEADTRRDEFDIKNEQIFYSEEKPDIIFAGDSITHYTEENRFCHKYGYVINRGIGSEQAHIMAWRFTADVTQLSPRLCIMLIGVNNTWVMDGHIDPETGDYEEAEQLRVLKEIGDAYRYMLTEAKENGFDMWVCSCLPVGNEIANAKIRNPFIVRLNKMLKALAEEFGTQYVDYHSALTKEDGLTIKDGITREGLHPKSNGYKLMFSVLEPLLDEYFGRQGSPAAESFHR